MPHGNNISEKNQPQSQTELDPINKLENVVLIISEYNFVSSLECQIGIQIADWDEFAYHNIIIPTFDDIPQSLFSSGNKLKCEYIMLNIWRNKFPIIIATSYLKKKSVERFSVQRFV